MLIYSKNKNKQAKIDELNNMLVHTLQTARVNIINSMWQFPNYKRDWISIYRKKVTVLSNI